MAGDLLLNLPLTVAALALALAFLPPSPTARGHRLDLPGQALGTLAVAAVVFALIEGGKAGFDSTQALLGGAIGAVALALFLSVEGRRGRPMLEPAGSRASNSPAPTPARR
ncbi:MAG: hypothetical protein ACTHO8_10005 [Solirubrobacterales bacterium]